MSRGDTPMRTSPASTRSHFGPCNRYQRREAALKSIGVDVSLTYDTGAAVSWMYNRSRLTADQRPRNELRGHLLTLAHAVPGLPPSTLR